MFPLSTLQLSFDFNRKTVAPKKIHYTNEADKEILHSKRVSSTLSLLMRRSVNVIFTNNRATMISCKKKFDCFNIRLHWMFKDADETILNALGMFLMQISTEKSKDALNEFIKLNDDKIKKKPARSSTVSLVTIGENIDLLNVLNRVKENYFHNQVTGIKIGWGKKRKSKRGKSNSTALATYNYQDASIRVNPVLDSLRVPDYMIDWIIYHEILHHLLPIEKTSSQNRYHTKKFRVLERAFPYYEEARKWEKKNINWLLERR